MPIATITADDTLTLFNRVFADLADKDVSVLTFNDDIATMTTGKNKNSLYAENQKGNNGELVLRVARGSSDDQFLNTQYLAQTVDLPSFTLVSGSAVKRTGDGQGNVVSDSYTMQGGFFMKNIDYKENVEGDTDQAVAVYRMKFALVTRGIK